MITQGEKELNIIDDKVKENITTRLSDSEIKNFLLFK